MCGANWQEGIMIFLNPEQQDRPLSRNIIQVLKPPRYGQLIGVFGGKKFSFSPQGITAAKGRFIYCPTATKYGASEIDALIIKDGRMRRPQLRDAQGIFLSKEHQNSTETLSCTLQT